MKSRKTSTLAATLHGFFTDYLPHQRALSPLRVLQSFDVPTALALAALRHCCFY